MAWHSMDGVRAGGLLMLCENIQVSQWGTTPKTFWWDQVMGCEKGEDDLFRCQLPRPRNSGSLMREAEAGNQVSF